MYYTISYSELYNYIQQNVPHSQKTIAIETAVDYLSIGLENVGLEKKKAEISPSTFSRRKDKEQDENEHLNAKFPKLSYEQGEEMLTNILGYVPAEPKKELWSLSPYENEQQFKLPSGDAEKGEIEITEQSKESLINKKEHHPVQKFVEVYVDTVSFMQNRGETDDPKPHSGKYVRIEPGTNEETGEKNPGAVILPVDLEKEKVLLVTQYRHPQRCFLTEAPRGFGAIPVSESVKETAKRELLEETGFRPITDEEGDSKIFVLKRAYTDTGKLTEAPGICLAFINRETKDQQYLEERPTMEDPCWINLADFYRAVFQTKRHDYVSIEECDFALKSNRQEYLKSQTPIDSKKLYICDLFTTSAALLAFPFIAEALKKQGKKDKEGDPITIDQNRYEKKFQLDNFIRAAKLESLSEIS